MTFAPFGRIDVQAIFKELGILDVKSTVFLEKSKFMYKLKNHLLPVTMANHFDPNNEKLTHSYNLRSTNKSNIITTRLLSSQKSIQICGERLWNEIPESSKQFTSFALFKRDIKSMLLDIID